jgi:hypothetical protein
MNEAQELIHIVEARGGRLTIEGEKLVIEPDTAALPLMDSLRMYKPAIMDLLRSRAQQEQDAADDSDSFGLWMLARCVYRDRAWGGVGALHLDLARWCADHRQSAPESRRVFVESLQAEGFAVTTDGLVYGLMLGEDLEAIERSQTVPQASGTPAQPAEAKRRKAGRRRA